MTENKQTAVEWLFESLDEQIYRIDHVDNRVNISISFEDMMTLKKQAKEMEQDQLALKYGEGYNEGLYDALNK